MTTTTKRRLGQTKNGAPGGFAEPDTTPGQNTTANQVARARRETKASGQNTCDNPSVPAARPQHAADAESESVQHCRDNHFSIDGLHGADQGAIDDQATRVSPTLSTLCNRLMLLGRRRNQVINRQRHINQPAEQQFKCEIDYALGGKATHGLTPKQLYAMAAALRKKVLGLIMIGAKPEQNQQRIAASDLEPYEKDIAIVLLDQCCADTVALGIFDKSRKVIEREMEQLAEQLPVNEWWTSHRGLGSLGLGKLIGETGDLFNYSGPCKLRKRMGLAPYKGEAMSMWARKKTQLNSQEWVDAGYSRRRRSVMFTLGDAIIKARGEFRGIYDERKREECSKAAREGLLVVTTQKATADAWEKEGLPRPVVVKEYDPEKHRTAGHIAARAQRFMEQRLLTELWKQWRVCGPSHGR